MIRTNTLQLSRLVGTLLLFYGGWIGAAQTIQATDYFVTIGGGYDRTGNQASLEANVVFFQQLLTAQHPEARRHDIYFADGDDPAADLQVLADKPAKSMSPATDLLAALHRRRGQVQVTYRNHNVAQIAGGLDAQLIRARLEALEKTVQPGDRLFIYVTAHGSPGPKDDPFNTTIDCWNGRKISAREFTECLGKLPADLPVVMVMAQCYCGGFGHSVFEGLDEQKGLAPQLRAGFFAQRHDLPAAGCRPDIEHDEEFSSYFWGALAGRSRNGVAIEGCDIDGNGVISFAEAHAYAVIAGETIDVPLRTSEVLLRTYSRLSADKPKDVPHDSAAKSENLDPAEPDGKQQATLLTMSGKLQNFVESGNPVSGRIVTQLAKSLGVSLQDDIAAVEAAYDESRRGNRFQGRRRGPRQGSGRRDLLREVAEKWPELGDERKWTDSPLLKPDGQQQLLAEIQQLPSWRTYDERREQMEAANQGSDQREIRSAKFRRLIQALESIALEKNLSQFATPQVVERYQQLLTLEGSTLNNSAQHK